MTATRLLIVEDSLSLQAFYRDLLADTRLMGRFDPTIVASAEDALKVIRKQPPDIAIVDWILPGQDGMAVLEAIRGDAKARSAMVFVVTSLSDKRREIEALQAGADDYLAKPFDREVLVARLLGLARRLRLPPEAEETLKLDELQLEMPTGRLKVGRRQAVLHNKEAELLRVFLKRPNMIHSADFLWNAVWGYSSTDFKNTLQVTLSSLRKKLGSTWGSRLENLKERGYLLKTQ